MTLVLLTAGSLVGALLFGLLGWQLCVFTSRRRSLAFALAGEITGILRLIETGGWESYLRETAGKRQARSTKSKTHPFFIPRPVIFETNAHALYLISSSVAREIAQFHALLGGIGGNAAATASDARRAGAALVQLEEALVLADDILRGLKPLLNRGSPGSRQMTQTRSKPHGYFHDALSHLSGICHKQSRLCG